MQSGNFQTFQKQSLFSHGMQCAQKPQIKKAAGSVSRGAGESQLPVGPGRVMVTTPRTPGRLPELVCTAPTGDLVSRKHVGQPCGNRSQTDAAESADPVSHMRPGTDGGRVRDLDEART